VGTPLNVYIAGGSREMLTVARPMIDRLGAMPEFRVTYDWTRDPGWGQVEFTALDLANIALRDFAAVDEADIFWLMVPAERSEGAASEHAYRVGRKGPRGVIVSGPAAPRNPFFMLNEHLFDTHEDALQWLIATAQARQ